MISQSEKAVFARAKELIERGWTKSTQARDKYNYPVDPVSATAVCWCFEGAIVRAASEKNCVYNLLVLFGAALKALNGTSYVLFNDDPRTQKEDVVKFLEKLSS